MSSNWDGRERRNPTEPTIFDYWLIFRKHIKLFIIIFLGIAIPAIIFSLTQPSIYQAKCVLLFRINSPSYITEQSEIASSHKITSSLETINIRVEPKRNSGIVTFYYEDKDKDRALLVVKKWVKRYLMLNSIYSVQQIKKDSVKPEGNILIITKPYLVGVVKPKRVNSVVIVLLFSVFAGLGLVLFKHYWETNKHNLKNKA